MIEMYIILLLVSATGVASKCKRCFPENFLFGVATSSYQIEGAWNESGKGENVWDWFTHTYPEKIIDGSNGDIACDSYNKYERDIEILADLDVDFYRFSIAWSRILPDGTVNNINQEGVNYYLTILKALKEKNIEPVVTLYHWDLPILLHQLGGWTNPEIADYFGDYARLCFKLFGSYVKYWVTLNEPQTNCFAGYGYGFHAPGYTRTGTGDYLCAYTQIKAHANAYHIYNDEFRSTQNGKVGIVLVTYWYEPLTNSTEDIEAQSNAVQFTMGLLAHPIYNGNWPQIVIDRVGNLSEAQGLARSRLPTFTEEEIQYIKGTHDYLGLNYYSTYYAHPSENLTSYENSTVAFLVDRGVDSSVNVTWNQSASSWLYDVPNGIRGLLKWVSDQYNYPQILITENGWSDDGSTLNDTERITYLKGHLCNVLKAKFIDGVNVFGYTEWSLMDNFEWGAGYTEHFGIVSVNFSDPSLSRTPKKSYYWYKNVVQSNCLEHCSLK